MATHCILLKKPAGKTLMSPGVVSLMDASGFDTVTARYIEQTTAAAVTSANKPGTNVACPVQGGKMIFMGVSETADLPGGCCEYTMTWRGLLVTGLDRDSQVTETRSVRERLFESITGIPGAPAGVRGRLLELQAGASVKSIHTTKPTPPALAASPTPPGMQANPGRGYQVINSERTYCYPDGWICYAWQSEEPLPGIWFVTAEYKFEQESTTG